MTSVLKSLTLALAGAVSLSSAALAEDVRVRHGDLDLSRPADAAIFDARVTEAAQAYCAKNANLFAGVPAQSPMRACKRHVIELVRLSTPTEQRRALKVARATKTAPVEVAAR